MAAIRFEDLIEMLPYALTLIALCLKSQKRTAPAALGKPYGTN